MLVVVVAVGRVQVLAVPVVGVVRVGRRRVATAGAVDVHVAGVREMRRSPPRGTLVDVVAVGMVEVAVVEVVEMIPVDDLRVAAPAVMHMAV